MLGEMLGGVKGETMLSLLALQKEATPNKKIKLCRKVFRALSPAESKAFVRLLSICRPSKKPALKKIEKRIHLTC